MAKGIIKVKNDNARLKAELEELKTKNPALRDLLFDLADWTKENLGKETIITMIFRTQEEQDSIYKDDKKYQKKKFISPHQLWGAADIRSLNFTPEEIKKIEDYLNTTHNKSNVYAWTAKNHKVGSGAMHFHIQLAKKA